MATAARTRPRAYGGGFTRRGQYVPSRPFGGRPVTARCHVCGVQLARLSPSEWVDRLDNKASGSPRWHEHSPTVRAARRADGGTVAAPAPAAVAAPTPPPPAKSGGGGAALAVVGLLVLGGGAYLYLHSRKPACPAGTTYDAASKTCLAPTLPPTLQCPSGWHVVGNACVQDAGTAPPPTGTPPPTPTAASCDTGGIGSDCQGAGAPPCGCPGAGGARPPCCVTQPSPGGPQQSLALGSERYYFLTEDPGWAQGGGEWIYHPDPNEFENEIALRIETDSHTSGTFNGCSPTQLKAIAKWWNGSAWIPFTANPFPPADAPVYVGSKTQGLCR